MQRILAMWATVHLAVIACSSLASIAPSSVQSRLLNVFRPYLALIHQDAEGVTLAVSRNLPAEKTHELQVLTTKESEQEAWDSELEKFADSEPSPTFLHPPVENDRGPAGGCRQRRWQRFLARVAELGEMDQAALAAWFVEPMVEQMPTVKQVRIMRLPDLMTTVVDDNAQSPYSVAVVRSAASHEIQLLQIPAKRLVAPTRKSTSSTAAEQAAP